MRLKGVFSGSEDIGKDIHFHLAFLKEIDDKGRVHYDEER